MIGKLIFKLPEESEDFYNASNGASYRYALHDFDMFLRSKVKYAPEGQSEELTEVYGQLRDKLRECLDGLEL